VTGVDTVVRRQRLYKMFVRVHARLMLRTGGRPAYVSAGQRCLVLETKGRRSNQWRRVPLLYMPDGDGYVVLASNFGQEQPPAWWLNLQATPTAVVQISGRRVAVRARELEGEERTRALARAAAHNKQWRAYVATMQRPLPVVRLERQAS
jgi:deazaflavin-dependent oxidoreductase (nitroreductase family)